MKGKSSDSPIAWNVRQLLIAIPKHKILAPKTPEHYKVIVEEFHKLWNSGVKIRHMDLASRFDVSLTFVKNARREYEQLKKVSSNG